MVPDGSMKNGVPHWSEGWSAIHTACGVGFLVFAPMIGNLILGQPFSAGSVACVIFAPIIYGVSRLLANVEQPSDKS
jgi:hypothetical protein